MISSLAVMLGSLSLPASNGQIKCDRCDLMRLLA